MSQPNQVFVLNFENEMWILNSKLKPKSKPEFQKGRYENALKYSQFEYCSRIFFSYMNNVVENEEFETKLRSNMKSNQKMQIEYVFFSSRGKSLLEL